MVAMLVSGMPLGQAAVQAPVLVQPPKPSSSMAATMSRTRLSRSGAPWGRAFRWVTLALVKSIAEPLGQAATHAPQPMHSAFSKARSASGFGTGVEWASGAEPVGAVIQPPAWMIRSNAERSTTRSFTTGNAVARQGSMSTVCPSAKCRMWS